MKKVILILLSLCLFCGLALPVYATGEIDSDVAGQNQRKETEDQQEPLESSVTVSTLEELQAAIDAAEDGDTIILSKTINLNNVSLICTKDIEIRERTDNHCFFSINGDCELSGLNILSDYSKSTVALIESIGSKTCNVEINNCHFIRNGNNDAFNGTFLINIFSGNVKFENCKFLNDESTTLSINSAAIVNIENCSFTGTRTFVAGGAINNSGYLTINNSEIVDNSSGIGGAIYNDGSLIVSNSIIKGNIGKNEFDVVEGNDIYSRGVLTITDEQSADEGFYEETTGEKLALPLTDYTGIARLTYLTEEQAAEYFAPAPDDNNGEDTPTDQPQEPGDQTGEDDSTSGEQPPQQPEQPSQGGDEDNSADTPPQPPQEPTEPPQDNTPDKPTGTTPDTPQPPQKPSDNNNSGYTPPADYRPSQRPTKPSTGTKPTEDNKPQERPTPVKPQLACNGAVIDTSRTVVLLGYGDGLLHEDDPLTRAQLATIIFRLLDDESIAKYSNAELAFSDIATDAWYAPYVRVIQAAGIVNGVGNGKYNPNGTVTWAQIITILTRFVEPQEHTLQHIQYSGWAEQAIQTAVSLGWIEDSADVTPDAVISRGELVRLVNGVLAMYR